MTSTEIDRGMPQVIDQDPNLLIDGCLNCIEQCAQILDIVSQENFVDESGSSSSIGSHIRHILDRFHCFFAVTSTNAIDYDARKRDPQIEQNLEAAAFALASLTRRIEQLRKSPVDDAAITIKESVLPDSPAVETASTASRELMGLITHSIHHLAIIAMLARSFGYKMSSDFGKAPSTIAYERA